MKAKIKSTGEVIEVLQTEDIITKRGVERQYVDNKRSWRTYVQSELEFIKEEPCKTIDWEQRRYEIAKEILPYLKDIKRYDHNSNLMKLTYHQCAYEAIKYADALIAELMKVEEK